MGLAAQRGAFMIIYSGTINEVYPKLAKALYSYGHAVGSTKELTNAMFKLKDPTQNLATCRNPSLSYALEN